MRKKILLDKRGHDENFTYMYQNEKYDTKSSKSTWWSCL